MPRIVFGEQKNEFGMPTAEWLQLRCGRITGSRLGDVMAYSKQKGKDGIELKARADYRMELLAERLTRQTADHFVTNEMKWGAQQEDFCRSLYEQIKNVMVEQVCFAVHPSLDFTGASPDGLANDDGIIEIKCLTTANHLGVMKSRAVPQNYYDQCQWNMLCCERERCDFICFDSRLPSHLQMVIIPVLFDEPRVLELEAEAVKMHAEIEAIIEQFSAVNQVA